MTIISQIKQKNNILDYLEETEEKYRYNTAVSDGEESLTWHELIVMAKKDRLRDQQDHTAGKSGSRHDGEECDHTCGHAGRCVCRMFLCPGQSG